MVRLRIAISVAVIALTLAACGGNAGPTTTEGPVGPGDVTRGVEVYKGTCATCHGGDAGGIDGLGKPLAGSAFVASETETELADFIEVGRDRNDPDNTTGVDMPPKGGNPSLTSQQLRDVAAYLISLNP
ncbi:MAG: cytochrome c [Acidimicrobiia bacterium]|nr:cytochrome c [Acidimicrobiia bacterium]